MVELVLRQVAWLVQLLRSTFLLLVLSCKTDGEKEDRGPNGDVGIEGNSGSDGKGEWSEMVRVCVDER